MTYSQPSLCLKYLWFCSPEHPSFRARGRSMLSGDRTAFRDFTDDQATSRLSSFLSLNICFYTVKLYCPLVFASILCL